MPVLSKEESAIDFYVTDKRWQFILEKSHHSKFPPSHNHIRSQNHFTEVIFPSLIEGRAVLIQSEVERELRITTKSNVRFEKPHNIEKTDEEIRPIYPDECSKRGLIYGGNVYIDVTEKVYRLPDELVNDERFPSGAIVVSPNVDYSDLELICERTYVHTQLMVFPTMIGSSADRLTQESSAFSGPGDCGGYFNIRGYKRIIQPILNMRLNYPLVYYEGNELICQMRCLCAHKHRSTSNLTMKIGAKGTIKASLNYWKCDLDIVCVFFLLGIRSSEAAEACVFPEEVRIDPHHEEYSALQKLRRSLDNDKQQFSTHQMYMYIGQTATTETDVEKIRKNGYHHKSNEFLPQLGLDNLPSTRFKKAIFLGIAIRKLLRVSEGLLEADDRDSPVHKKLDLAGERLAVLVKAELDDLNKILRINLIKKAEDASSSDDLPNLLDATQNISNQIITAIANGNWSTQRQIQQNNYTQNGVTKNIEMDNITCFYSFLSMITNSVTKQQKDSRVRQLKNEAEMIKCCVENPEGNRCGVNEHLCMFTYVRIGMRPFNIEELLLLSFDVISLDTTNVVDDTHEVENDEYYENMLGIHSSNIHGPLADSPLSPREFLHQKNMVFVNGNIVGTCLDEPTIFVKRIRSARRGNQFPWQASIVQSIDGVFIWVSDGCLLNPCIVLENLYKMPHVALDIAKELNIFPLRVEENEETKKYKNIDLLTFLASNDQFLGQFWMRCIRAGIIEYQSKEEELSSSTIAEVRTLRHISKKMNSSLSLLKKRQLFRQFCRKYSHVRVDDSQIFGICAALIPFPDFNQSPRNMYQTSMAKAAIMSMHPLFEDRFDAHMRKLMYAQKAIVRTQHELIYEFDECPCGINAIVAILCYSGFNMEDSILMNKGAIDRGAFRIFSLTVINSIERKSGNHKEHFENPALLDKCYEMKHANYDKLDIDGNVPVGTKIVKGDVIIGKTIDSVQLDTTGNITKCDRSIVYEENEECVVDKILITISKDGCQIRKVVLRAVRIPQVGDKFASRAAQKGTIGMILNQEDMPFTREGITPDIIINPHAFPGRMTNAQILESICGKVGALNGTFMDGTPFQDVDPETYFNQLHEKGYERYGNERMTNGMTGEHLEATVMMGIPFYQRLKHMPIDKIHGRPRTGPISKVTHQPLEGRAKHGGGKLGEMERDALTAHGAANVLQDKFIYNSDYTLVPFCVECHNIGSNLHDPSFGASAIGSRPYCPGCKAECALVQLPYAFKLLMQEAQALMIKISPELKVRYLTEWLAPRVENIMQIHEKEEKDHRNIEQETMRNLWDNEQETLLPGMELKIIDGDTGKRLAKSLTSTDSFNIETELQNFQEFLENKTPDVDSEDLDALEWS
jgi:DNA-directed RNA polymerase II subunit RPB2